MVLGGHPLKVVDDSLLAVAHMGVVNPSTGRERIREPAEQLSRA